MSDEGRDFEFIDGIGCEFSVGVADIFDCGPAVQFRGFDGASMPPGQALEVGARIILLAMEAQRMTSEVDQ